MSTTGVGGVKKLVDAQNGGKMEIPVFSLKSGVFYYKKPKTETCKHHAKNKSSQDIPVISTTATGLYPQLENELNETPIASSSVSSVVECCLVYETNSSRFHFKVCYNAVLWDLFSNILEFMPIAHKRHLR